MKFYSDAWLDIYQGDVRDVLPELASDSVDCIVTSPPYWGLRDYGNNGQLGLERTPEEYVANLVAVFRELRRVLKPSGTCWLNLGDSYAGGNGLGRNDADRNFTGGGGNHAGSGNPGKQGAHDRQTGLKPKDLVGIPWRVAFALQADGWYLRSDIIWSKPNPMPESVTDRPTKSHEYLFLLTKSARYFFDADAVREPVTQSSLDRIAQPNFDNQTGGPKDYGNGTNPNRSARKALENFAKVAEGGRNLRSVWTIATRPYPGAHFAVFPPELPERCIKAGSSERGVCPECGAPWKRQTERTTTFEGGSGKAGRTAEDANANGKWAGKQYGENIKLGPVVSVDTIGWQSACNHPLKPQPAVILDPFAGSGTTGMVANRLSRRAILIDLNGDYLKQQLKRNAQTPLGLGA